MPEDRSYWLVKNNPKDYSVEDLARDGSTAWVGVRNYEARNNLQAMEEGDLVLYYHSSARPSGVAGIARVAKGGYPDPTAFDEDSRYYDEDSDPQDPTWYLVDLEHVETFEELLPLPEIKKDGELSEMVLVNRSRLSVQPVRPGEFERVRKLAEARAQQAH